MSRRRFILDAVKTGEEYVTLRGGAAHHAANVLRVRPGDAVEAGDGRGRVWKGIVTEVAEDGVRIQLMEEIPSDIEAPVDIVLALSLSRTDRMELALRQATELGVTGFVGFRAARSQYGLSGVKADKRSERWTRIVEQALCQCGRTVAPQVLILENVTDLVKYVRIREAERGEVLKVVALEGAGGVGLLSLRRFLPDCSRVVAVVGPEGGWEPSEAEQFIEAGFRPVSLGPRILRLETAATALLATIQLLWGDLGDEPSEGKRT